MALRTTLLIALTFCCIAAKGQGCTELLSQAEQDYRDGRFKEMKQKLCRCFGAYQKKEDDSTKVLPRRMRAVLEKMNVTDQEYAAQLGIFRGYWKEFITKEDRYTDSLKLFFTYEERYRAFLLLAKLYQHLGVLSLADFFIARAVTMYPETDLEDETPSFRRLFNTQHRRVSQFSFGPLIGWSYAMAVSKTNYRQDQLDYRYRTDGRIVLGAHFDYPISPSLAVNMNFWFHGTNIVYTTASSAKKGSAQFDFYHQERQAWIKFPLLIKWSPANHFYWLRKQELWKAKVFIAGGVSANYLTGSNATIADLPSRTSLYSYDVTDTRNRFNCDAILQFLTRFQVGHNYLNIGFTGTYSLKNILNDVMVKSPDNMLFRDYGIVENNYKLAGGFWTVTYEFRFNYLKRQ